MKFNSARHFKGERGRLTTSRLKINDSCLSFSIHTQLHFDGSLRILIQKNTYLEYTNKIHEINISQTTDWVLYQVPIPSGEYRLIFEGEVKAPLKSDFALDDVVLEDIDKCAIKMASDFKELPSKYFDFESIKDRPWWFAAKWEIVTNCQTLVWRERCLRFVS